MATALDLIKRSMRLARVIGKGETPDSDESQDGLTALNAMLDMWQIQRLFVYSIREESFTWTGGQASRTVGTGGNFVTDRPTRVDDSTFFTLNGIAYPVELINSEGYSSIPDKTVQSSVPEYLYVDYTSSALVTLYAYPVPSSAIPIKLRTWRRLQSFAALTDTVTLPPGYEDTIAFSLAEKFGIEFGKEISDDVKTQGRNGRAVLKRINSYTPIMATEVGLMGRRTSYNVFADF